MEILIARLVSELIFETLGDEDLTLCDTSEFVTVDRVQSEYDNFLTDTYQCNMLKCPDTLELVIDSDYFYVAHLVQAITTSWESIKWDIVVELVKLQLFKTYTLYCQNVASPVN